MNTSMNGGQVLYRRPQPPVATAQADWKPVTDVLGRTGTLMTGNVYRIPLPRKDLTVTTQGVPPNPACHSADTPPSPNTTTAPC
jgi:hypothetical protein